MTVTMRTTITYEQERINSCYMALTLLTIAMTIAVIILTMKRKMKIFVLFCFVLFCFVLQTYASMIGAISRDTATERYLPVIRGVTAKECALQ